MYASTLSETESVQVTVYLATSGYVQAVAVATVMFFLAYFRERRAAWAILGSGTLILLIGFLVSIILYQSQPQSGLLLSAAPYIRTLGWVMIMPGAMTACISAKSPLPHPPYNEHVMD